MRDWVHAHVRPHGARRERAREDEDSAASSPPIWLPQPGEPVTAILSPREKLPARTVERTRATLVVAIVVPCRRLRERELAGLVVEYVNPGGRVRLRGRVTQQSGEQGILLRIDSPELIDVVQQRRHVRVAAECPIALRKPNVEEPIFTHTFDISAGGALLAHTPELQVLDELDFTLAITPGAPPIRGSADIVRVDDLERPALYFTMISPADRWRLIRFTVDCQSVEPFRHPALDDGALEGGAWQVGG